MKKGELAIFVTMCVLSIVLVCIGLTMQGLHLSAVAVVFAIGCAILRILEELRSIKQLLVLKTIGDIAKAIGQVGETAITAAQFAETAKSVADALKNPSGGQTSKVDATFAPKEETTAEQPDNKE